MTSTSGPLTWPYLPACTADSAGVTDAQYQQAVDAAVEWVWSHSGRRFGTRQVVLRPQAPSPDYQLFSNGVPRLQPVGAYGYGAGYSAPDDWGPQNRMVLELDGPLVSVEQVQIGPIPMDPSLWRVEGDWLVRHDGGEWPQTQNLIAQLGTADTWAVRYTQGVPVSPMGQVATGLLVCYMAGQLKAGKPCVVPYNATTVTRGGMTINRDMANAQKVSGVREVDQWMSMVNPAGLQQAPIVWSPDVKRRRQPFAGSFAGTPAHAPVGVPTQQFLVLGPDQAAPPGTPVSTLIFRTGGQAQDTSAGYLVLGPGEQVPLGTPVGTQIFRVTN